MGKCESKVVYLDGTKIKVLRGNIDLDQDPDFVIIHRDDGEYRIRKKLIHKIEPVKNCTDRVRTVQTEKGK